MPGRPARIDQAVRLILEAKYRLGLFEDPYRYSNASREAAEIYRPAHLEAARDMARRSMVLKATSATTAITASASSRPGSVPGGRIASPGGPAVRLV